MASRSYWLFGALGALVLCTFSLIGCSPADPVFSGRVRDKQSGEVISRARIEIAGQEVSVDGEGKFTISLDVGRYETVVSASGYLQESFSVHLDGEAVRQIHDVRLEPRVVRGQVFDASTRQPLSDVRVSSGGITRTTEADGRFILPYPGRQPLSFAGPCYHGGQVANEALETRFTVSGTLTEPLSVFLTPRTIEGVVREEGSGEPVAGAIVRAGEVTAHSDDAGHYRLTCVPPDSTIAFSSPAHHPYTVTYGSQLEEDVSLEPWRTAIHVLDVSTGQPLAGARLVSSRDEVSTDADGWGTLRVSPDEKVRVLGDGYGAKELTFTGQSQMEVSLRCSRLTIELEDGATGKPVKKAVVLAYGSEDDSPTALRTDDQGTFILDDISDIQQCLIKAPGYLRTSVPITRVGRISIPLEEHEIHGVYIPFGILTVPERLSEILDLVQRSDKLNGIVVDVKSDKARIAWPSELPVAQEIGAYQEDVVDLREFVQECKERGIYTIARMVIFKDDLLAQERPEWAVKRESGEFYLDWEDLRWTDPFRQEVRDYNIDLALEVAAMGFDEIQFDYLRFPSDGKISDLVYEQESTFDTRTAAMNAFCAQAYEALSRTTAFFSADVFGLTVWVDPARDLGIGQRIDDIAPHVDYLSPMLYPTTFIPGNLGYAEPARYPYEVIYHSIAKLRERSAVAVRPWLQHYSLGSVPYGVPQFLVQRKAAEDAESAGWLFWNAGARYDEAVFEADPYHRLTHVPSPPEEETGEAPE